jgi:integrase
MPCTLSELIQLFLAWSEVYLHKKTARIYTHYLKKFLASVGDKKLEELKKFHLQAWAKTWHEFQAVQRLFTWGVVDAEIITKNPFKGMRKPPLGERRRILSRRESISFLRGARKPFRSLMLAYRETYARPQELRLATFEDLKAENPAMDIDLALRSGQACIVLESYKCRLRRKDPNTPRVILLSPRVGRMIARLRMSRKRNDERIFKNAMGKEWSQNAVRCCFRRLRKRIQSKRDTRGENIVPYSFRHSGATAAAASGVRDRMLAELLGHTSTRTTARYQHLSIEHLRSAMQKLWIKKRDMLG